MDKIDIQLFKNNLGMDYQGCHLDFDTMHDIHEYHEIAQAQNEICAKSLFEGDKVFSTEGSLKLAEVVVERTAYNSTSISEEVDNALKAYSSSKLKINQGLEIKDKYLDVNKMKAIHDYYEVVLTQEYIYENYCDITPERAYDLAMDVRENMRKCDVSEEEAIDNIMLSIENGNNKPLFIKVSDNEVEFIMDKDYIFNHGVGEPRSFNFKDVELISNEYINLEKKIKNCVDLELLVNHYRYPMSTAMKKLNIPKEDHALYLKAVIRSKDKLR